MRSTEIKIEDLDKFNEDKLNIIAFFHSSYYDTDQDTDTFAAEFYVVVDLILSNHFPIKLEYLEDWEEEFLNNFPHMKSYINS